MNKIKNITVDEWRYASKVLTRRHKMITVSGGTDDTGIQWNFSKYDDESSASCIADWSKHIDTNGGLTGPAADIIHSLRMRNVRAQKDEHPAKALMRALQEKEALEAELAELTTEVRQLKRDKEFMRANQQRFYDTVKRYEREAKASSAVAKLETPRKPRSVWLGGE